MPRHTWTVRVELCETFDAVYAHAYLDHVPIQVSGHGQAPVSRHADVVGGRAVAHPSGTGRPERGDAVAGGATGHRRPELGCPCA